MPKADTSRLEAKSADNLKNLEDIMSQVMRQNGLRFWKLDMAGHRMQGVSGFGRKNFFHLCG